MPAWPTALGVPDFNSFQDRPRPNVIEAPVALGTPKRRRRWTGDLREITFQKTWNMADYRTFIAFYKTDLADGLLSFTMDDGILNEADVTWLLDGYSTVHVGPGTVRCTITLTRIQ